LNEDSVQKNIVLDTSTDAGRNLLTQVLPDAATQSRFFLASLYRTHYDMVNDHWKDWAALDFDGRSERVPILTKLFHHPRTLGGMRPMTELDRLVLRAWSVADFADMDKDAVVQLLQHPVAMFLSEIARAAGKYGPLDKTEMVVAAITHCFCRLLQDPFPFEDTTNAFNAPHSRLFEQSPPENQPKEIPAKIVAYVCRDIGGNKKNDQIKKQQPILWELLNQSKEFLCTLSGTSEIDQCFIWLFRHSHDFEHCMLKFLDMLMCIWTEVLIAGHSAGSTLSFLDHDIFVKHKSAGMLKCCKKVVQECRRHCV
jgi:hypothetical protein